jgi:hypothetical protein
MRLPAAPFSPSPIQTDAFLHEENRASRVDLYRQRNGDHDREKNGERERSNNDVENPLCDDRARYSVSNPVLNCLGMVGNIIESRFGSAGKSIVIARMIKNRPIEYRHCKDLQIILNWTLGHTYVEP